MALLLPALSKAKDQAMQIACASNLRQMALGIQQYVNDNDGFLPPVSIPAHLYGENAQFYLLAPYVNIANVGNVTANNVFYCPSTIPKDRCFYHSNGVLYSYAPSSYAWNHELTINYGNPSAYPRNISTYTGIMAKTVLFYEWRILQEGEGGVYSMYVWNCSPYYSGSFRQCVITKPAHKGRNYFAFMDGHVTGISTRPNPADYITNDIQWVP